MPSIFEIIMGAGVILAFVFVAVAHQAVKARLANEAKIKRLLNHRH